MWRSKEKKKSRVTYKRRHCGIWHVNCMWALTFFFFKFTHPGDTIYILNIIPDPVHLGDSGLIGSLTFRLNVVAKNHPFSAFLSPTKSRFFVRKDNDLIHFPKICQENDNDYKLAKICPDAETYCNDL